MAGAMRAGGPDQRWKRAAGLLGAAVVAGFFCVAFGALLVQAGSVPRLAALWEDAHLRDILRFTLWQASLSTLFSVIAAVPLGVALHRVRFPGRRLVLRLFLLPQALPVLVGALGILAVWGRGGVVSNVSVMAGGPRFDVYGLSGILLAHVFFNMPLATRLVVAALDAVPAESWKLAGQLALPARTVFRLLEWPAIRSVLPGAASLVFMLCVTSFTLVLVLGGGPAATTLEVAIYQSLRYDFDPERAVLLGLGQVALTAAVLFLVFRLGGRLDIAATLGRPARRFDRTSPATRLAAGGVIGLGFLFLAAPFAAILVRGLAADLGRLLGEAALQKAALTSIAVAGGAACLSLCLSLSLLFGSQTLAGRWRSDPFLAAGSLVLVVPPIVLGAGWFLFLRGAADVFAAAPLLVLSANAVLAMPFVMRILGPALAASAARHDRLAASLGLSGLPRLRHVEWPALRAPLGLAFAFAVALSLGDLGVAALFGNQDFVTLPLLLQQRMGSYRTADAAGIALILACLCLCLMALAERGFARSAPQ